MYSDVDLHIVLTRTPELSKVGWVSARRGCVTVIAVDADLDLDARLRAIAEASAPAIPAPRQDADLRDRHLSIGLIAAALAPLTALAATVAGFHHAIAPMIGA